MKHGYMKKIIASLLLAGYFIKIIHSTGYHPMIEKRDEFNHLLDETITDIAKGH
jgi:hypothetical protein